MAGGNGRYMAGQDELRLGARLRHARLLRGMRLKELAGEAGCSESMASKIENDKVVPSLTTLHRLCKALGTNVSTLLNSDQPQPWTIMRAGTRQSIGLAQRSGSEGTRAEVLVPFGDGRLLEGFVVVIEPGGHSGGQIQHKGEEVGYVLEGTLELTIEGRSHRLVAGDSFHFPSDLPHSYGNAGTTELRVVWINTPPTF